MLKRHFIILVLILLASAVAAQLPGANAPKYQHKQAQASQQQSADSTAKVPKRSKAGSLKDFLSLVQDVVEQDNEERNLREQRVFIISQEMVTENDDQVGAKMTFYNCFPKFIKEVDVYFVPCNVRGAEIKDAAGQGYAKARCEGRINSAAKAETFFPNLFWNRDKEIQYLEVAKIVFTFFDNTTAVYNGVDEVRRHYQ